MAEEIGEDILAHALDDEAEEDAEQEDEGEDLQRMPQSRLPDGALMALLVVVGLVAVDLVGIAGIAAAQGSWQDAAQDEVQHKAHRDGVEDLDDHQQHQLIPVGGHRDQQRHGFIAGGEEDRDQRAQRDDAGRIKVRCNGGKAALRHTAQQRRRDGTPPAAALQHSFDALAVAVLHIFDEQVSQKQEREHLDGIHKALAQNIQKQFHNRGLLAPARCFSFINCK